MFYLTADLVSTLNIFLECTIGDILTTTYELYFMLHIPLEVLFQTDSPFCF